MTFTSLAGLPTARTTTVEPTAGRTTFLILSAFDKRSTTRYKSNCVLLMFCVLLLCSTVVLFLFFLLFLLFSPFSPFLFFLSLLLALFFLFLLKLSPLPPGMVLMFRLFAMKCMQCKGLKGTEQNKTIVSLHVRTQF